MHAIHNPYNRLGYLKKIYIYIRLQSECGVLIVTDVIMWKFLVIIHSKNQNNTQQKFTFVC